MIGVALKGLLGRKLRAILTGFAIVLGVAMISGSYVLTDTLSKSFDSVYDESYAATDAIISSKQAIETDDGETEAPAFSAAVLREVETLPGVRVAQGSIEDEARLVDKDGTPIGNAGSGIAWGVEASADQSLNPLELAQGDWPSGDGEIAIDKATAEKQDFAVGQTVGAFGERRSRPVPDHRDRHVRRGRLARRVVHLRLRSRHRPEAVRQAGQVRPDPCRRRSRRLGGRARDPDPAAPLRDDAGPGRGGPGGRGQQGDPGGHGHHQVRPARLRRDLALRRQLRDREHARDHRRAADARARDAADARRLAGPGAPLGGARVGGDRDRRLVAGPLPRARHRRRADGAPGDAGDRAAKWRARLRAPDDHRQPRRRDADRAPGEPSARSPRDPDPADRGGSRGRRHACIALRALCGARVRGRLRGRARALLLRRVREWARDDRAHRRARARRAAALRERVDGRLTRGASAGLRAGRPRRAARRHRRRAGTPERGAEPDPDRLHGGCSDDRAGPDHLRRRARPGRAHVVHECRERALRGRLCTHGRRREGVEPGRGDRGR